MTLTKCRGNFNVILCSSRCSLKKSDGFILTVNDATIEEKSGFGYGFEDISKGQT